MERFFTLDSWMDDEWYVGKTQRRARRLQSEATLDDLEANIRDAYHLMVDAEPALARPGIRRKDIAV